MAGIVVDANPIINDPFAEPTRYWSFRSVTPTIEHGRRISGYLAPSPDGQLRIIDELIPLEAVNDLRDRVRQWRLDGYDGATLLTKDLFRHWFDPEREATTTRPFFAQQEAIETIAFLVEARSDRKVGISIADAGEAYERWATKMATGTGKTLVMAMLIAWHGLNRAADRHDARFTDNILVVAPNLTVKARLAGPDGLDPQHPKAVYTTFDLLPPHLSACSDRSTSKSSTGTSSHPARTPSTAS